VSRPIIGKSPAGCPTTRRPLPDGLVHILSGYGFRGFPNDAPKTLYIDRRSHQRVLTALHLDKIDPVPNFQAKSLPDLDWNRDLALAGDD
jgi:hypothetical protein